MAQKDEDGLKASLWMIEAQTAIEESTIVKGKEDTAAAS